VSAVIVQIFYLYLLGSGIGGSVASMCLYVFRAEDKKPRMAKRIKTAKGQP
jgi:hypothetical protein